MAPSRRFFVLGNWKMNVNASRIESLSRLLSEAKLDRKTEFVIGCPSCYLSYARQLLPSHVGVAAQNSYKVSRGNFSGEVSPAMVQECGADWIILGHPERRTIFGETDDLIAEKITHALSAGAKVVACVVERKEDRNDNLTEEALAAQMRTLASAVTDWSRVVLAFEALWASGTGVLATPSQVQKVLSMLRRWLRLHVGNHLAENIRIIYAGSVSAATCQELACLPDLDGFLVGSAALKPDLIHIVNARHPRPGKLPLTISHRPDQRWA
ncbi:Triosephosphate isomerase B [Portunus trituberculatus]|uniref:Triosephosphate isomerase n=1 Tax=Portunus trituberculatus TaxID=210409 RepID=A0A5B7FWM4_PORTR|nr:Triosephosphate isomerase B [Portunus trituberculatus]